MPTLTRTRESMLCKNNPPKRKWNERMLELFDFLCGVNLPKNVTVQKPPKLSPKMAMTVIWFLQEVTQVLPDHWEMCDDCQRLYDSYAEGDYQETTGKHYCDCCAPCE